MAKNNPAYKVKVTIGDAVVEVEGSESGVVKIVEALSQNLSKRAPSASSPSTLSTAAVSTTPVQARPHDVRTFFAEKTPSSDIEAVTAAAYYYKYLAPEDQRRDTINSELLQTTFRLARRPLPPNPRATLQNTRNAGYLDSAGAGEFRINAVGYNLVEHSLGSQQQNQARAAVTPRRRKRAKKPTRPR